ncbi:MAG: hypothetical protein Q7J68_03435 [Thermoplasmata archaeon]|nr:hypothetical protein [Thermoplasmata archaeon]
MPSKKPKSNLKGAREEWEKSVKGQKERQDEFITTSSVPIESLFVSIPVRVQSSEIVDLLIVNLLIVAGNMPSRQLPN